MTTTYTDHFRFGIPDFLSEPWHDTWQASVRAIDEALYQAVIADGVTVWANNTVYAVGDIVIDPATGLLWSDSVTHTSAVAPSTFADERTAHPTYWSLFASVLAISPFDNALIRADGLTGAIQSSSIILDDTGAVHPNLNDGGALGTSALMWSDLFLASGGVINWNNGDISVTHTANQLSFTGAATGYSFDANILLASGVALNWNAGDVTLTHSTDLLTFGGAASGYAFGGGPIVPTASDGTALGTIAKQFSDLFLAEGGVINWDNGDVTITQTNNVLSFAGATTRYEYDAALTPSASDGAALGTTALMWSDAFFAAGGIINFNNGDVLISHGTNVLTFTGATAGGGGYQFDVVIQPTANDGAPLGSTGNQWSDLFLASGAVVNWNNGAVTLTHSLNTLSFAGANIQIGGNLAPNANDGGQLGVSSIQWSDLFLATGGVINWNNGDVTLTHAANQLNFGGASVGYYFDAITGPLTTDGAALGSAANQWSDLFLATGAVINFNNGDVTATHAADTLTFAGAANGFQFSNPACPSTNDGAALGATALQWSDLFLASGAVINFANGDVTITHATDALTFAGAANGYTFSGNVFIGTNYLDAGEIASPSNPAADHLRIFAKDVAGVTHLFSRDSAGTEIDMGAGGGGTAATQADQEAASSTSTFVSPARQQFHPSALKAFVFSALSAGVPQLSAVYNVTSITDVGTGRFAINFTTNFSSANYGAAAVARKTSGNNALGCAIDMTTAPTASAWAGATWDDAGSTQDSSSFSVLFGGDQ